MITVLSMGAGQESTAILYRLALDQDFYRKYVKGKLLVIMSDTGDEHPATYAHVEYLSRFCAKNRFLFILIKPEMGFHPKTWPSLVQWMRNHHGIMSVAYPKTCTVNLKIVPIYNFLEHYIGIQYYQASLDTRNSRKKFIKQYARDFGKINVLIGIASGEEHRCAVELPCSWMKKSIHRIYPLIETGFQRRDCQKYIIGNNLPLPYPSNCMRCPFLNEIELIWLYRNFPEKYHEWVRLENEKIEKWETLGLAGKFNYGIFGKRRLPEVLQDAFDKFPDITNDELNHYKMSHGHCVMSKY